MIQIELQPEIESQLAAQAEACGVTFSEYLKELLVKQAERPAERVNGSVAEAIESIRELRKGNKLGGLKIKELIHEGHKY
jgi:5,10-methylenetetrahydrofolate reductase